MRPQTLATSTAQAPLPVSDLSLNRLASLPNMAAFTAPITAASAPPVLPAPTFPPALNLSSSMSHQNLVALQQMYMQRPMPGAPNTLMLQQPAMHAGLASLGDPHSGPLVGGGGTNSMSQVDLTTFLAQPAWPPFPAIASDAAVPNPLGLPLVCLPEERCRLHRFGVGIRHK